MERSPITVLMLSANPKGTDPLRLDEERREVEAGLMERSRLRDSFRLVTKVAVRPRDFQRAMLDHTPQILHFSGHGGGELGLALEDDTGQVKLVAADALASLFELFADRLECVVLNACYSEAQAQVISEHIPYVIGMSDKIGDRAAIEFAVAFYDALGSGRDVAFAYKSACVAIKLAGIAQDQVPVLHQNPKLANSQQKAVVSPSQALSHNLTENQVSLLRWLVGEVRADRLNEEKIEFCWTLNGVALSGYPNQYQSRVPDVNRATLKALQQEGCIVCDRETRSEYRFALTRRGYDLVDSVTDTQLLQIDLPKK